MSKLTEYGERIKSLTEHQAQVIMFADYNDIYDNDILQPKVFRLVNYVYEQEHNKLIQLYKNGEYCTQRYKDVLSDIVTKVLEHF